MIIQEIRDKITEAGYGNSICYDDMSFDKSIIGVDENGKTVYDYNLMIEEYIEDEHPEITDELKETCSDEYAEAISEACEWIDYNTIRATPYMGVMSPVIIYENPEDGKLVNAINGEDYTSEIVFKL